MNDFLSSNRYYYFSFFLNKQFIIFIIIYLWQYFSLFQILRTLTTTTEVWWHMPAVTSGPNQRSQIHTYGWSNGQDSFSLTLSFSLSPLNPIVQLGRDPPLTPLIYGKHPSFVHFLSPHSHTHTHCAFSFIQTQKSSHLGLNPKGIGHKRRDFT